MKKVICADSRGTGVSDVELEWFNQGNIDEFLCKCGCGDGVNKMRAHFLLMLDNARDLAGVPFSINSGYRCPAHNKAVGSTSNNHPSGLAVDIRATDSVVRGKIISNLVICGFRRFGLRPDFIHADLMRVDPENAMWYY